MTDRKNYYLFDLVFLYFKFKKEVNLIDKNCRFYFNFDKENNGSYDRENNIITVSLNKLLKHSKGLKLDKQYFTNLSFSFFHERKHLIDFKYENIDPEINEMICLEGLAFDNKRRLYSKCYHEIWYENRAFAEGYKVGLNFLKENYNSNDFDKELIESVNARLKKKDERSFCISPAPADKYTSKENVLKDFSNVHDNQKSLILETKRTTNFPFQIYSIFDFDVPKKHFIETTKTREQDAKHINGVIKEIDNEIKNSNFYSKFKSLEKKEQLIELIKLDLQYEDRLKGLKGFSPLKDKIIDFHKKGIISKDVFDRLGIEVEPEPEVGRL